MEKFDSKKEKNIIEYNVVRVIAVILVVISHCTYYKIVTNYGGINYMSPENLNITSFDEITIKLLTLLKNILYTFHMPLFFALSGALFKNSVNNNRIKNFKTLLIQKAKRLLIPFIIIVFTFSIPIKYFSNYFKDSTNIFKDIFIGQILLQGNNYLWFLPTLFFEFLIVWLINKKIKNKRNKIIFLIFFVLLNITSPIIKTTILRDISIYIVYFYIGYCFDDYRMNINKKIDNKKTIKIMIEILCIIITIVLFTLLNFEENKLYQILKPFLKIFIGVLGSYLIYLISYKLSKTNLSKNKIINKINECSFGIYLYSDPLNYLILYIIYNIYDINVFYTNPGIMLIFLLRLVITFSIAFVITIFLRKKEIRFIC